MTAKKTYVLRLDEETYRKIERWAGDEFRSINGQIEWILVQALRSASREAGDPKKGPQKTKPPAI